MIHHITRPIRAARRALEAARRALEATRREMVLHDKMAYHSETWTAAQWDRTLRYSNRLTRIAHGRSPWVRFGNI